MLTELDQLLLAAAEAQASGNFSQSEQLCMLVLSKDSANLQAKTILGAVAAKRGNSGLAISLLDEVVGKEPDTEALILLASEHRKIGNLTKALELNSRAVELGPENPFALNEIGLTQIAMMLYPQAAESFRRAADLRPDVGQLQHNLGKSLIMQGLINEALPYFQRAVQLDRSALYYMALSRNLFLLGRLDEAEEAANKAIEREPRSPMPYRMLAETLSRLGKAGEALDIVKKVVELSPNDFNAHSLLGKSYQSVGLLEEADSSFQKSISLEPRQGFAYFAIVHNKRVTEEDRGMLAEMQVLLESDVLPKTEIEFLHYGVGKAYENLGDYQKSMVHFDEANRIAYWNKFGNKTFDKEAYAASIDQTIEVFSRERMMVLPNFGSDSEKPILVVGMLRSGTTLVEQILSSHPEVAAGGELDYWVNIPKKGVNYDPDQLSPEQCGLFAEEYLKILNRIGPEARRVTDKMPQNILWLGFILNIFPNARIIHTRRNGADTCISNFTTSNQVAVPYAHDKENIAFVYEQYLKLAEYWRKVLPLDRYLEVDYEDLVLNREPVTRRMVEFCGLEWDDRCLKQEDNESYVLTPSAWQVRQPIYSSSIGRWKNYETWLGPFAKFVV